MFKFLVANMQRIASHILSYGITQVFLRPFRDPIRVPRISNRVPRIKANCHGIPEIRKNRVPRIREIGSLQIHAGYLTYSLKKLV